MGLLYPIEAVGKGLLGLLGGPGQQQQYSVAQGAGGPADPSAMPQATSYTHPVRDAFLRTLGGAAGRLADSLDQNDMTRLASARFQQIHNALAKHPEAQQAFDADPPGFTAEWVKNFGPQHFQEGDSVQYGGPGGQMITAPKRVVVSKGASVVDTGSGDEVYSNPSDPPEPSKTEPPHYAAGPDGKIGLTDWYLNGETALAKARRGAIVSQPMPGRGKPIAHGPNIPAGWGVVK